MEHTTIVTTPATGTLASRIHWSTGHGEDRNAYLAFNWAAESGSKDTAVWGTKGFNTDACPDLGDFGALFNGPAVCQVQLMWIN